MLLYIPPSCLITALKQQVEHQWELLLHVNLPVLGGLEPHVPAVLRVEASQEQVGVGLGGHRARVLVSTGTRAAGVGLQRGAETHPHWVGGPIGACGSDVGRSGEAAGSDQNQLVSSTLPPHGLGGVETATEETI